MVEQKDKIKVTYELPTSVDGSVFGPSYWQAFHDLASKVPCGGCRQETESFIKFFHDLVNYRLGKQIYDKKNFIEVMNKISALKNKPLILK